MLSKHLRNTTQGFSSKFEQQSIASSYLRQSSSHLGEDGSGEEADYIPCQVQDAGKGRELSAVASSGVQHDLREAPTQSDDSNGGRLQSCTHTEEYALSIPQNVMITLFIL